MCNHPGFPYEFSFTTPSGRYPVIDRGAESVGRVMLSLVPERVFIMACIEPVMGSLKAKIATSIALRAVVERALSYPFRSGLDKENYSVSLIKDLCKEANSRVYSYAQQMRAVTEVAARGFFVAFDGNRVTIASTGTMSHSLWRGQILEPLHPLDGPYEMSSLGASSKIRLEIASFDVWEGDVVVFHSSPLNNAIQNVIENSLKSLFSLDKTAARIVQETNVYRNNACQDNHSEVVVGAIRFGRAVIPLVDIVP